jgi:hypothetical protein
MSKQNAVNKAVLSFLKEHCNKNESIIEAWKEANVLEPIFTKKNKSISDKRRPRNAYIFFCNENRDSVKKDNPDINSKEMTILLSQRWNAIKNTPEVERYNQMAISDKEKQGFVDKNPSKGKSPRVIFGEMKKDEFKKIHPSLNSKDLIKEISKAWKDIKTTEEGKQYFKLSRESKGLPPIEEHVEIKDQGYEEFYKLKLKENIPKENIPLLWEKFKIDKDSLKKESEEVLEEEESEDLDDSEIPEEAYDNFMNLKISEAGGKKTKRLTDKINKEWAELSNKEKADYA